MSRDDLWTLTPVQLQYLQGLADGKSKSELCLALSISESTVDRILSDAKDKLETQTPVHAVVVALRRGLI